MIRFIDHYFTATDARGCITGLVNFGEWREINLIRSDAGVTRGNHYHKTTEEGFIILDGCIDVVVQSVREGRAVGEKLVVRVKANQVFIIEAMVCHEFIVNKPAVWINFLSNAMDPGNLDIHRLEAGSLRDM